MDDFKQQLESQRQAAYIEALEGEIERLQLLVKHSRSLRDIQAQVDVNVLANVALNEQIHKNLNDLRDRLAKVEEQLQPASMTAGKATTPPYTPWNPMSLVVAGYDTEIERGFAQRIQISNGDECRWYKLHEPSQFIRDILKDVQK